MEGDVFPIKDIRLYTNILLLYNKKMGTTPQINITNYNNFIITDQGCQASKNQFAKEGD